MDQALKDIARNAREHEGKYPTLRTLLGEVAELAYALDGEHEHRPDEELVQLGGLKVNWLRRIYKHRQIGGDVRPLTGKEE